MEDMAAETSINLLQVAPIVVSFLGGGLITAWWAERSNRRRETRQFVFARLEELLRSYQRYVRMLRSPNIDNKAIELDSFHADFLASARLLSVFDNLSETNEPLKSIARNLANLRNHEFTKEERDERLKEVSAAFERVTKQVIKSTK